MEGVGKGGRGTMGRGGGLGKDGRKTVGGGCAWNELYLVVDCCVISGVASRWCSK